MTRFPYPHSRPKHPQTQDALERLIIDLRTTLDANEPIGTVQRQHAIEVIHEARRDVERCRTPFDEFLKRHGLMENDWPDHMILTGWLTALSMDLHEPFLSMVQQNRVVDNARLDEGLRLVRELENCREELRYER